jgi:hypothetical protein
MQKCIQNLDEESEVERPLRDKWKRNVNICLEELRYENIGWIYLDLDLFSAVSCAL